MLSGDNVGVGVLTFLNYLAARESEGGREAPERGHIWESRKLALADAAGIEKSVTYYCSLLILLTLSFLSSLRHVVSSSITSLLLQLRRH